MDDLLEVVTRMSTRIENLEQRIAALETLPKAAAAALPISIAVIREATPAAGEFSLPQPAGVFPVIGRAMLGIAGAYVLRALWESTALPQVIIVAVSLAYAASWLIWATRERVADRFANITYTLTAALILAPMLGELTLRFHILPSAVTAALLGVFALASAALAWKRGLTSVAWVGIATGVCTALALMIVSRDLAPYTAVLLLIVVISEVAAARQRWLSLRALVAPAVDIAIWTLVYVYSLPESSRVEYTPVSKTILLVFPLLLLLIYGASVVFRTVRLRQAITIFEIGQTSIAFALAGASWFWNAHDAGMKGFGVVCWIFAAGCYASAFFFFNRGAMRNYRVFAAWSAALVLVGSFLVLPPSPASLLLSVTAIAMTIAGARLQRLMPGYQAFAYLSAAAFVSGLLRYVGLEMAGTLPSAPPWTVWVVAGSAIACYGIAGRFENERWNERLLRFLLALLAVSAAAAFLISAFAGLMATGIATSASQLAVVRTVIACAFALALAFAASRWRRSELMWTAYCALAFVTAKLLFEDLRFSHSGSIAVSLVLYAVALILVPRLGRMARQQKQSSANTAA